MLLFFDDDEDVDVAEEPVVVVGAAGIGSAGEWGCSSTGFTVTFWPADGCVSRNGTSAEGVVEAAVEPAGKNGAVRVRAAAGDDGAVVEAVAEVKAREAVEPAVAGKAVVPGKTGEAGVDPTGAGDAVEAGEEDVVAEVGVCGFWKRSRMLQLSLWSMFYSKNI
jgi:hypothetical protein